MRAAIHARRSTEEHQAASVEVQLAEAKRFIEAQQERVGELGDERLYDNAADAARRMARRAVSRYAREHNPA